jgi:hypothetical protein
VKYLTRKELILTALSVPLGFLASVLATWFTTPSPRLEVRDSQTMVGGRTAITLRVENTGDIALTKLVAKLRLRIPADMSVEPAALAAYAKMNGASVEFIPPESFELKPGQALELGFISSDLNAIADRDALPATIFATSVQVQQVPAALRSRFSLPTIPFLPFVVGVSLTANLMLIGFFIKLRRRLVASQPETRIDRGETR